MRAVILMFLLAVLPACQRKKIDEDQWKAVGARAVLPFKQGLKQALVTALGEGPVHAISACRVEAPRLAEAASTATIRVGRASRKVRNPSNATKPWMQPLLEQFETNPDSREPTVVLIDERTVGYVEPIFVEPLCVTCHGSELAPDLKAKIEELYPGDQATGYRPGDFRGVFWAELARE
jgi:hypothetical protein